MDCCISLTGHSHKRSQMEFEEFFDLNQQESVSPFITDNTRKWGVHLSLKVSFLAAILWVMAFSLSWYPWAVPFSYLLLTTVYFLAGIPALIDSIEELAAYDVNIDMLMTLAAFSSTLIGSGMEGGLLLVLFALSGSMEEFVTTRAKSAISSLHKLSPSKASVIEEDGTLHEKSIKDIAIGNMILVKAGQIVPLDGQVIDGISSVNLVHLTGENLPVKKSSGNEVPAGARNMEGALTMRVMRTSADSTLARIIQLVTQAQAERPLLQRWFDKLSRSYALAIIGLSAVFAFSLPWLIGIPFLGPEGSIYRSLAFLIAASPCALIIAIPIAYLSAIGACARQGILLKGGITLDAIARCSAIAFDKTGTLTTGQLTFTGIEGINNNDLAQADIDQALAVAYALERNAVHPIAHALVEYGQNKKLPIVSLVNFTAVPGYGLSAQATLTKGPSSAYIGNPDYTLSKVPASTAASISLAVKSAQEKGELTAILLLNQQPFLLRFNDTIRPGIKKTIDDLKRIHHLSLMMLTGDHINNAKRVAAQLDMDDVRANLKPEDKLYHVSQIAAEKGLAMVGDGINDAPALARATVGICMGKVGSTAALDAADVVLLQDNIEHLSWLFKKAHLTQKIVIQNLGLATAAILIASIPAVAGFVPLWLAVIMHEGGTVLVGLNGLRLLKK